MAEARAELQIQHDFWDSWMLPRPCCFVDGDGQGNALIYLGMALGTRYSDPAFEVGVQMRAAPGSLVYRCLDALEGTQP